MIIGKYVRGDIVLNRILDEMDMDDEERQVVGYGLRKFFMFIISLLIVAIIGVLTNEIFNLVVFLLLFIPLRIFAGGLHLSSLRLCALMSVALIYGIALVSKHIQYVMLNQKMIFMVCIIAAITIICLAPVDTINKKLYNSEKRRFKCISEIIVFVELFLFVSLKSLDTIKFMICIVFVLESIFLIIQIIVNYFREIGRLENYD